jgi:hypothetical protein
MLRNSIALRETPPVWPASSRPLKRRHRDCRACGRRTLHAQDALGSGSGCLLTVLTRGRFLLIRPGNARGRLHST